MGDSLADAASSCLAEVAAALGQQHAAAVCSSPDGGAQAAMLRYIFKEQADADARLSRSMNVMFTLFSGYLVFIMQAGFAMLCAGHARGKNMQNILSKNMADCAIGTLAFYTIGTALAFGNGEGSNGFIGVGDWALSSTNGATVGDNSYHVFFFHWAFSAAAATIVAGAVAERMSFGVYLAGTALMTSWTYPVAAHWLWTQQGWLSAHNPAPLFGSGAIDFAGGGPVHVVGGWAALWGALMVGPRIGRFCTDISFRNNNPTLVVLGSFLLMFGWYGFNPGSALMISSASGAAAAARAAVTTTLAGAAGSLLLMTVVWFHTRCIPNVLELCNGSLAGIVAVTACCGVVEPWVGLVAGALGALVFLGIDVACLRLKIDDVVSAVPMHAGCGMLGVLLVGFFARRELVEQLYPFSGDAGVFYGGDGRLLACQVIEVLVLAAWTTVFMGGFFWAARRLRLIRVPLEQEVAGLDATRYGVLTTNAMPTVVTKSNTMANMAGASPQASTGWAAV